MLGGFPRGRVRWTSTRSTRSWRAARSSIDTRPARDFAIGSRARARSTFRSTAAFTTWAGWLVPYDRGFLPDRRRRARRRRRRPAVRDLAMIGLDRVAGYFDVERRLTPGRRPGRRLGTIPQIRSERSARVAGARRRHAGRRPQRERVGAGHIAGARHIPLGYLADRARRHSRATSRSSCSAQAGAARRSAPASSARTGVERVINLDGWHRRVDEARASGQN